MQSYRRNKFRTALQIFRGVENWPTGFDLRLRRHRPGLRMLNFRDGLNLVVRGGTRDWDVAHELIYAGGYGRALEYLRGLSGRPLVLDLGGNLGLFSLLAARANPNAEIFAYEPGPPNFRLFEINALANPSLGARIHLRKEAVGGHARETEWFFDDANPGGSSLYGTNGSKFPVHIAAFADVVAALPGPVALAKIDIEGAEFELLAGTPPEVWRKIGAVALELHDDPAGKMSRENFLQRLRDAGFTVEEESVVSFFLHR
ncbi:MAG: FkbM family methyltransferase [Verrucomicrobia bacterium]|nr:FkbM family methyltransferase [Verrucomicrobiota bacterium]